jgi:small subunit ribosomal protein S1
LHDDASLSVDKNMTSTEGGPTPESSVSPSSHTGREQSAAESITSAARVAPVKAPVASVPLAASVPPAASIPPAEGAPVMPSRRDRLSPEMEDELAKAMGGVSFDDLMAGTDAVSRQTSLEAETRCQGRVVAIRRDEVFVELGGREQGCVPLHQFSTPPEVGSQIDVIIQRFNAEEGLYDLGLPGTSVDIANWDDVQEGMLVEAQITGSNTGGLECEVNHIRAFIPISQVALYRVEDLSEFVGQRFACLITEANPMRKNLVLSRRAVLEREKEENRQKVFDSLKPGQVYQGVVRKLMDFGAFIDLGNGVDGLLHVSQLSWGRVNHPKDVLTENQSIQVKVEKVDHATGRISLSYRDMLENPWTTAGQKYLPHTTVHGKVTKLMEFGAFVELEPGVEGLIHISELSHKRVWRASDVVHEGDEVDVMVLSVDTEAQRMSLSLKALSQPAVTKKDKEAAEEAEAEPLSKKSRRASHEVLRGGLGKTAGGEQFGLNW